jgi:DNA-binding SARP family transcriptional activator
VTSASDAVSAPPGLRLQVMGPVRVWRDGVEVDPGPRQQAYLLALLLASYGEPIAKFDLISLVWGDRAPASALNIVHKYVGALRRLLEPHLPAGDTSTLIVRRGDSYLCTAGPDVLDLARFRALRADAERLHAEGDDQRALAVHTRALELWAGPAGDGLPLSAGAFAVFAGVDEEFFHACVEATDLAVAAGEPGAVLPALLRAAPSAPLHEPLQSRLVAALGAAGRQAEALSVFGDVRARLVEELGIDPGPALAAAREHVLLRAAAPLSTGDGSVDDRQPAAGSGAGTPGAAAAPAAGLPDGVLGRDAELAVLREAIGRASSGETALVVLEGEPGAGKTHLLEHAATEAAAAGHDIVWGRCTADAGAPSLWPWAQVLEALVQDQLPSDREDHLAGPISRLLEPGEAEVTSTPVAGPTVQFQVFEQVVDIVRFVARQRPVVIVLDDLQWADAASLRLLAHLAARLPSGTVVLTALREGRATHATEQAEALAVASRCAGHRRLALGPLAPDSVAALIERETGSRLSGPAVGLLRARTSGNPFFVRELARLLARGADVGEDDVARLAVPVSVRDVVKERFADLDEDARRLLEAAAVLGPEVGLALLAGVAGADPLTCLALLEPLRRQRLLEPVPGDPGSVRFVHDLVREAVLETTGHGRAARLHLRCADAVERLAPRGPSSPERVAHHLWRAGPLVPPERTVRALLRAGRRAAARSALEDAEELLGRAAAAARRAGLDEDELAALAQLTAVVGMRSMYVDVGDRVYERIDALARSLGREVEAAAFLYSRWSQHAVVVDLTRSEPLARRLVDRAERSEHPLVRAYAAQAWGVQQLNVGHAGEGYRHLHGVLGSLLEPTAGEDVVRRDLRLLSLGGLARAATHHGEVAEAHEVLDVLRDAGDDAYAVTVWATTCTRVAVMTGDARLALRGAEVGIAADPTFAYVYLGTYQRLAQLWARAVTGVDPAASARRAAELVSTHLEDPDRSCVSTWYGLLSEMWLAADRVDLARHALLRAEEHLARHEQRYAAALIGVQRARLERAEGAPLPTVRATLERARRTAEAQEAHLFARRAEALLDELG